MTSPRVGFIGLGIMGTSIAKNLLKASYPLTVYNRSKGPIEELVKSGARAAYSCKEAAQGSEIVITMLPDSTDAEQTILGPGGILEGAEPSSVIINMSSIAPLVSQWIAAYVAKMDVDMLDATISGGQTGAVAGSLAIMESGRQDVFDRCLPILRSLGKSAVRVGKVGAGNFVKLANQNIVATNIQAFGEAFVLAPKAGINPELVFQGMKENRYRHPNKEGV